MRLEASKMPLNSVTPPTFIHLAIPRQPSPPPVVVVSPVFSFYSRLYRFDDFLNRLAVALWNFVSRLPRTRPRPSYEL